MSDRPPITRSDCQGTERPCPWASCKFHLLWERPEAWAVGGHLREDDHLLALLDEMPETCVLDVADRGELTMEQVAHILGVTRQRVNQIEDEVFQPQRRPKPSGRILRRHRRLKMLVGELLG